MINSSLLEQCTIIIRSSDERTEQLCRYSIIRNGVNERDILMVKNVSPFSQALRVGFDMAIKENKKFSIFIDADLVLLDGAIVSLLTCVDRLPKTVFSSTGLVYDYLTGCVVAGGPHLYRTEFLPEAIKLVPEASDSLRPETFTMKQMQKKGYQPVWLDFPLALHDFEQNHIDNFRKVLNRYLKSGVDVQNSFIQRIDSLKSKNQDFSVASLGLEYFKNNQTELRLDSHQFDSTFLKFGIKEKESIGFNNVDQVYNKLMSEFEGQKDNYLFKGYTYNYLSNKTKKTLLSKVVDKLKFYKSL